MTEHETDRGVRVVGATPDESEEAPSEPTPTGKERSTAPGPSPRAFRLVAVLAALGLAGTLLFGVLYATDSGGRGNVQPPEVIAASRTFLTNFFNFDAKSLDHNFNTVEGMATGSFSNQAQQFFNSNIRKALESALAESRGQIRNLDVQSYDPAAGTASIYAVIDQTYVNNKISTPQSDVVRLTADLKQVNGTWKISNVTVLEGATPQSAGSSSGSAGSSVPGQ